MPTNTDTIIAKLSPAQRKKVEARAAQLIAGEMALRELRQARKLTQDYAETARQRPPGRKK